MPSIAEKFSLTSLTPWTSVDIDHDSSAQLVNRNGKWSTTSFYTDSNCGQATVVLPLHLRFASAADFSLFLANKSIVPTIAAPDERDGSTSAASHNASTEERDEKVSIVDSSAKDSKLPPAPRVSIEAKVNLTVGTGCALSATVEEVKVVSTRIVHAGTGKMSDSLVMYTEISLLIVRAKSLLEERNENHPANNEKSKAASGVKINLEVTAAYWEPHQADAMSLLGKETTSLQRADDISYMEAINALENSNPGQRRLSNTVRSPVTRLKPALPIYVTVTHAVSMQVRNLHGPFPGKTLLAVTIRHSNTHANDLTVSSISLHPRLTRSVSMAIDPKVANSSSESIQRANQTSTSLVGQTFVGEMEVDMSHSVYWGFVDPLTDLHLPLTLKPKESYATVLIVDAIADEGIMWSQCYACPLSITVLLGSAGSLNGLFPCRPLRIEAISEALWSTRYSSKVPTDSLRVDLTLHTDMTLDVGAGDSFTEGLGGNFSAAIVGEPLAVYLVVFNLSPVARKLMLLVDTGRDDKSSQWAISSDYEGYKLEVRGPDSANVQRDLLIMDEELQIGELQGLTSKNVKVRMIPLRQGTLNIPNFKLVDNRTGRRYYCIHRLKLSATAAV